MLDHGHAQIHRLNGCNKYQDVLKLGVRRDKQYNCGGGRRIKGFDSVKNLLAIDGKLLSRAQTDIGRQPVRKVLRFLPLRRFHIANWQVKHLPHPLHHRTPAISISKRLGLCRIGFQSGFNTGFQGKPRHDKLHEPVILQSESGGKHEILRLRHNH